MNGYSSVIPLHAVYGLISPGEITGGNVVKGYRHYRQRTPNVPHDKRIADLYDDIARLRIVCTLFYIP